MKRTILKLSDFEEQAAAILAASKTKWADARMEDIEGDEDDGAPGDEDDDDPDDDAADKGDDDKKDDKDSDKDKSADEDKVDRAEYERVKRHRAAADRRVATLEAENTQLKNQLAAAGKDGKDGEGTSERVTELQSEVEKRDSAIHELRIQNAFLSANQFTWHDAGDALRLADLSDVEIEDDGTVVGLKEALTKLAREKPHLIKSEAGKDAKDDKRGSSGSANNGKRKGDSKKPDRAALSKTYPVLGARR